MTNKEAKHILINESLGELKKEYAEEKVKDAYMMAIKALEQEPKTGRWLYDGMHHGLWHYCSECGEDALVSNWKDDLTPYCPNCGAKMEGVE